MWLNIGALFLIMKTHKEVRQILKYASLN